MKWTGLNELREKYLSFFESKGHLRLPSFPLIPQNDNSLLLINSGMAPMKKYFTGEITPPRKRVTTCQKCIRTPDIERVGKTARHGTYFEMLGNFSFGDYFKHEATAWAWEFCTKVLELPVDNIWVSIYQDDDEAFAIWTKEVGVKADHIVRLGKEDNFWEHGMGPCGPCSELYFDRGPEHGCGKPDCAVGCDCDRFVEFWNLVFTQFENDGKNNYTPLDHPNIDTGMGLERLACIMQGVNNLFEVDTVQNIMKHISRIAGVTYGKDEKTDVSLRVITDHIRSTTFMIADGVMPSNEGRGYVLRRLLRRAARHGRLLGIHRPFLSEVCDTVIEENKSAYPELVSKKDFIKKLLTTEEENFEKTIDKGLSLLSDMMEDGMTQLSGENAFKLYDTYGFPIDLTREILDEKGISIDEDTFERLMREQKERARNSRESAAKEAWAGGGNALKDCPATRFTGYTENETETRILQILTGGEEASGASAGAQAVLVLEESPFYAESGGQAGDKGIISCGGAVFEVTDTTKTPTGVFLHTGTVVSGAFRAGENVTAKIDVSRRNAARRNHTAAHLLQAALRKTLGTHVEQAGQLVTAERMRFDFTHFSALAEDELRAIEAEVNKNILAALPVETEEMPIEEARKRGAMALFGEKYGDVVRVVGVPGVSMELCGGTHVDNTAKLGLFQILSESSVAAGVRRVEAITGAGVLEFIQQEQALLSETASALKVQNKEELPSRAASLTAEVKKLEREVDSLNSKIASAEINSLLQNAKQIGKVKLVAIALDDAKPEAARRICDAAREKANDIVTLAAVSAGGKLTFACSCGKEAVAAGAHAGNIVREVAKIAGGSGGGRADSAMAGGKDVSKRSEALSAAEAIVAGMLK